MSPVIPHGQVLLVEPSCLKRNNFPNRKGRTRRGKTVVRNRYLGRFRVIGWMETQVSLNYVMMALS